MNTHAAPRPIPSQRMGSHLRREATPACKLPRRGAAPSIPKSGGVALPRIRSSSTGQRVYGSGWRAGFPGLAEGTGSSLWGVGLVPTVSEG